MNCGWTGIKTFALKFEFKQWTILSSRHWIWLSKLGLLAYCTTELTSMQWASFSNLSEKGIG